MMKGLLLSTLSVSTFSLQRDTIAISPNCETRRKFKRSHPPPKHDRDRGKFPDNPLYFLING
ncbi:MAG: hypothetical protein J7647_03710 [Cyanobacteria bacterium SBLK]|nr:hypothetical protein [Cyanobacteria bacterium SBLK]